MSANRKLSEDIDKHNAAVMGLVAERDALLEQNREMMAGLFERDALKALNAELVQALQLVPALRPLMLKEMGYVPESVLNITNAARSILDKVRP